MFQHKLKRLNDGVSTKVKKVGKLLDLASRVCVTKFVEKKGDAQVGKIVCEKLKGMGPTFVKIGQFISTRSDIFGKDFTGELKELQDNVAPMDKNVMCRILVDVHEAYPGVFESINDDPLAAASIGQVHYGKLADGTEIAIKFKREGIDEVIHDDFSMLLGFVDFIKVFSQHRQVQEIDISLREYYALLLEEIDFKKEVSNMVRFASQFKDVRWIKVPRPYTDICTDDMIVMEYVPSIKINDVATIEQAGLRTSKISQKLLECFFTQIVQYGFVHIDPHPGNVGIIADTGKIVFYDYGMFVELNGILKENIKQILIALYDRDIDDVCELLLQYDIIKLDADRKPYFKKFIASFLSYLDTLNVNEFQVSYLDRIDQSEVQFLISSKFILLLRGISIMEGNCKMLDPNFNYREILDPFINEFIMDISYLEKRGTKDIQRFTSASDRIVTSEISLSMVEKDIQTLKKKYTMDFTKYKVVIAIMLLVSLISGEHQYIAQATSVYMFLYILYSK